MLEFFKKETKDGGLYKALFKRSGRVELIESDDDLPIPTAILEIIQKD